MYFPFKEKTKIQSKKKENITTFHCTLKNFLFFSTRARTLPCPYDAPSPTTFFNFLKTIVSHIKSRIQYNEIVPHTTRSLHSYNPQTASHPFL